MGPVVRIPYERYLEIQFSLQCGESVSLHRIFSICQNGDGPVRTKKHFIYRGLGKKSFFIYLFIYFAHGKFFLQAALLFPPFR